MMIPVEGAPKETIVFLGFKLLSVRVIKKPEIGVDYILFQAECMDCVTHEPKIISFQYPTPSGINIKWDNLIRSALIEFVRHEVDESLVIEGQCVFDPHRVVSIFE